MSSQNIFPLFRKFSNMLPTHGCQISLQTLWTLDTENWKIGGRKRSSSHGNKLVCALFDIVLRIKRDKNYVVKRMFGINPTVMKLFCHETCEHGVKILMTLIAWKFKTEFQDNLSTPTIKWIKNLCWILYLFKAFEDWKRFKTLNPSFLKSFPCYFANFVHEYQISIAG